MVTCPNCGNQVPSSQRYCGNCGADVQAAMASRSMPVSETQQSPYAYNQPAYDYNTNYSEPSRGPMRLIILVAVLLLVGCCACAFGAAFGFFLPDLLGLPGAGATPRPTPRVTPTPQTMLMLYYYFIG